jgi:predicted AlkP superfamily phosphohydrolase/phosphomutase
VNLKGRQPNGCVAAADARPLIEELKAGLQAIPHPETGKPLVEHIYERDELYHGPYAALAPDLTVVLTDWRYRTIGLHDFTTNRVIAPAFGPTGDHRLDGILIASGPPFLSGATLQNADLLDVAPTVLDLLGIPAPPDMDGRVLTELLKPAPPRASPPPALAVANGKTSLPTDLPYNAEEEAAIQQRLADLGYL